MGIIDVVVEKPAFKRLEGEEKTTKEMETAQRTTSDGPDTAEADSSRGRTLLKSIGALAIGALGMLTFRKLRNRRTEPADESAVEERVQTGTE